MITPKLKYSRDEALKLDDFGLCDSIWQAVVDAFYESGGDDNPSCNCPESLFATKLPDHWWVVYSAHAFVYDAAAGGIRQFFDNHDGLTNTETETAFQTLGLSDVATYFAIASRIYFRFRTFLDDDELSSEEAGEIRVELSLSLSTPQRLLEKSGDPRAAAAKYARDHISLFIPDA